MFPDWLPVYGERVKGCDKKESWAQQQFFKHIRSTESVYGRIAFHPKNESKRSHGQVWYDRNQGLTSGVSDIIIPASPPFVCELKRASLTDNAIVKSDSFESQLEFLQACQSLGAFVCLARGLNGAIDAFNAYKKQTIS